jgi:hypothetical protein
MSKLPMATAHGRRDTSRLPGYQSAEVIAGVTGYVTLRLYVRL